MNIAIRQAKLHILPLFYDRQISVLNVSCAPQGLQLLLVQVIAVGIVGPFAGGPESDGKLDQRGLIVICISFLIALGPISNLSATSNYSGRVACATKCLPVIIYL